MKILWSIPLALIIALSGIAQEPPGKRFKPIELNPDFEHNKWGISPTDIEYRFAAYITSFDSADDDNGDGESDIWGVPEWVAFEIKRETGRERIKYKRPSPWLTDDQLNTEGIAPNDATYAVSGTRELKVVKTDYRYVRGHMCPKNTADRINENAGYNTHTVLNAVPQLQWQNNGIWKDLEQRCEAWADTHERIWIVCGPVFFGKNPAVWLGQKDNVKAAVPDAIYKIVIRAAPGTETGVETLAFIFPNVVPKEIKDIAEFLTSIDDVEGITGLDFLTHLDEELQDIEEGKHAELRLEDAQAVITGWNSAP